MEPGQSATTTIPALCHVDSYAQPVLNPIEQVRRYCEYLVNFNGALAEHPERVSGVAYLHNATEFGVSGLREIEHDQWGQLFTGETQRSVHRLSPCQAERQSIRGRSR